MLLIMILIPGLDPAAHRIMSTIMIRSRNSSRRLQPAAQHLGHAPGLRDATARRVRLARVEHFADRADPVLVHAFGKPLEEFARVGVLAWMDFEPRVDERPDEPGPDRALMVSAVP